MHKKENLYHTTDEIHNFLDFLKNKIGKNDLKADYESQLEILFLSTMFVFFKQFNAIQKKSLEYDFDLDSIADVDGVTKISGTNKKTNIADKYNVYRIGAFDVENELWSWLIPPDMIHEKGNQVFDFDKLFGPHCKNLIRKLFSPDIKITLETHFVLAYLFGLIFSGLNIVQFQFVDKENKPKMFVYYAIKLGFDDGIVDKDIVDAFSVLYDYPKIFKNTSSGQLSRSLSKKGSNKGSRKGSNNNNAKLVSIMEKNLSRTTMHPIKVEYSKLKHKLNSKAKSKKSRKGTPK